MVVKAVEKAVERAALSSATAVGEGEGDVRGARSMIGRGLGREGKLFALSFDGVEDIVVIGLKGLDFRINRLAYAEGWIELERSKENSHSCEDKTERIWLGLLSQNSNLKRTRTYSTK